MKQKPKSAVDSIKELVNSTKGKTVAPKKQQMIPNDNLIPTTANLDKTQSNKPWQFQKGQSGNPSGPKPGYKHFKPLILKKITETLKTTDGKSMTAANAMIQGIVKQAIAGNVPAFREIVDRVDGKAEQAIEVEGNLEILLKLDI